jgi:hypothetical protein
VNGRSGCETGTALLRFAAVRDRLRQRIRKLAWVERKVTSRPEWVEAGGGHGPVAVKIGQTVLRRRGRQTAVVEHAADRCCARGRPRPLLVRECIAYVAARRVPILREHRVLIREQRILECSGIKIADHGRRWDIVSGALIGAEHCVEVVVGQRQRVHGAGGWRFWLVVAAVTTLRQCGECGVAVQRMRTRNLVGRAGDVSSVVVAVAWLVVPVREDGQMTFRVRGHELGLCARVVESLLAGIELELNALLGGSAETLAPRMTLAAVVMNCETVRVVVSMRVVARLTLDITLVFDLLLVFLVATVALGVVRLGLARTTTVLALLDGTTLGVDVVQLTICRATISTDFAHVVSDGSVEKHTAVGAAAHSVTLDAGRASPLLSIDNRHSVEVTAGCGRRRQLEAVERLRSG